MNLLSRQASLLLTGALAGDKAAGILGASLRISRLVVFGLSATNMIVAPMISELYHGGRRQELQRVLTMAAWGIFTFTVIISVLLIISGPWVLGMFGTGFSDGYLPLLIVLGGQIVNSCTGAVGYIMVMTGHQNQAAIITVGSVAVNVTISYFLVSLFGATGGAVAMSIALIFWNVAMMLYVWRKLGLNATIFPFGTR
jgi:O-antigen/teichoic acid export membrane protein